ncbi:uncharacterized protein LOC144471405 [Augochlora pura]
MCSEKVKMFLLLFISLVSICDSHVLSKRHSTELDGDVNDLSHRLTAVPPLSDEITELTPTTQGKQKANRKYTELVGRPTRNVLFDNDRASFLNGNEEKHRGSVPKFPRSPPLKLSPDSTTRERRWPQITFDEQLRERGSSDKNGNAKNGMTRRNQKKAKALGRLLLNNVSKKNEEDNQDDYLEDDDDDYSKNENRKKMNWEEYRNEDGGASVMELVALNVRHKTNMQLGLDNDYFS